MVLAQHRLLTEQLNIRHLRLLIGNSMGGMHAWIWGVRYPDFMDALVPMASQPTEMSGRNCTADASTPTFDESVPYHPGPAHAVGVTNGDGSAVNVVFVRSATELLRRRFDGRETVSRPATRVYGTPPRGHRKVDVIGSRAGGEPGRNKQINCLQQHFQ